MRTLFTWMKPLVAGALLVATSAANAHAQTVPRRWSVSFDAGAQFSLRGDVHSGGSGTVLNLPGSVTSGTYRDVYGPGFFWAGGVGYAVNERGELRAQAAFTSNPSDPFQVGTLGGQPLFAGFENYNALALDFGYRQYLASRANRLRPFIGGAWGFTRVDRIRSTFRVPAANATISDVGFYGDTTTWSFNTYGGLQVGMTDRLAVQALVDFRWHGDLKQVEGLAGTGFERINNQSRRFSMPLLGGMTVRF